MARYRRNPAPLSGAIFVRNGRRRRNGLAIKANRRRNGLAIRANKRRYGRKSRRNSLKSSLRKLRTMVFGGSRKRRTTKRRTSSRRRNTLVLRANRKWGRKSNRRNGLAIRTNKRWGRKSNRKYTRRNGLAIRANKRWGRKSRKNGLAIRANRKWGRKNGRRYGKKYGWAKVKAHRRHWPRKHNRRNGLAIRANSRRWAAKRRYHRNPPRRARNGRFVSRRRNANFLTRWMGKLPGGKMLVPALGGAAMLLPVNYALSKLGNRLPAQVRPVAYTASGLAVGLAAGLLGKWFAPLRKHRKYIATTAVLVGGAVDALRYLRGTSYELGDGFAWEVVPYSGTDSLGSMYADAAFADAYYTDSDLSGLELGAARGGAFAWQRTFGPPPQQMQRIVSGEGAAMQPSRHAQEPGHRWGWLIALVGFANFQKIAAMDPSARQNLINQLREQAMATVQAQASSGALVDNDTATAGFGRTFGGMLYAGAAY